MLSSEGYPKSTDEIMSDLKRDFEGIEDEHKTYKDGRAQMQGEINPEDLNRVDEREIL